MILNYRHCEPQRGAAVYRYIDCVVTLRVPRNDKNVRKQADL